jgi:hypothetical protein
MPQNFPKWTFWLVEFEVVHHRFGADAASCTNATKPGTTYLSLNSEKISVRFGEGQPFAQIQQASAQETDDSTLGRAKI